MKRWMENVSNWKKIIQDCGGALIKRVKTRIHELRITISSLTLVLRGKWICIHIKVRTVQRIKRKSLSTEVKSTMLLSGPRGYEPHCCRSWHSQKHLDPIGHISMGPVLIYPQFCSSCSSTPMTTLFFT